MHHETMRRIGREILLQAGRAWFPLLGALSRLLLGSHTVSGEGLKVTVIGEYEWTPRQLAVAEEALSWLSQDSPRPAEERCAILENLRKLMVMDPELNRYGTRIFSRTRAALVCHDANETDDPQKLFSLMLHCARLIGASRRK